jgi:glutathione synthase/RimK-type ligase-like ATP-grasp enzyme
MQTGEFIINRLMVGFVSDICRERGIEFRTYSNEWVLELKKNGITKRVIGYKFALNDAAASGIAGDKVAAHLLLQEAGIPSVPHRLLRVRTTPIQKETMTNWGKVVVKPLDGSGGFGVRLFENLEPAIEWVGSTDIEAWAVSPFLSIEREIRVVMLDKKPLIVYEKQPVERDGLRMFNLGLGATPKDIVPDELLLTLAANAQEALGLRLSAVDIIETAQGERLVLEINSGFMMEHYARFSPEYKQRTIDAYAAIIDAMMA